MGLTKLTRYDLFMNAVNFLEEKEDVKMFLRTDEIRNMYYNSAILIKGIEDVINARDEMAIEPSFKDLINKNFGEIKDSKFVDTIRNGITKQEQERNKKNLNVEFKDHFRFLLKTLTEYQNEIIDIYFIKMRDVISVRGHRSQTFLSYAYCDKGLTLALYFLFAAKGGFLYVNWMWEGTNKNSKKTKHELENALLQSEQFLFLRTTNSELHVRGNNNSIRQWCSWEIGFYYTRNQYEKYYTSFYDKQPVRNDMLDSFNAMIDVVNGRVVS